METRRTVMMILVTTVLALGLTVYGESLEKKERVEVVNRNSLSNYNDLKIKISE